MLLFIQEQDKAKLEGEIQEKLRNIDKFAIKRLKTEFNYRDYIAEKELKTDKPILLSEAGSEIDIEDDLVSDDSGGNKVNALDLEKAYEMYLSKKEEIMKTFENNDEDDVEVDEQQIANFFLNN